MTSYRNRQSSFTEKVGAIILRTSVSGTLILPSLANLVNVFTVGRQYLVEEFVIAVINSLMADDVEFRRYGNMRSVCTNCAMYGTAG